MTHTPPRNKVKPMKGVSIQFEFNLTPVKTPLIKTMKNF